MGCEFRLGRTECLGLRERRSLLSSKDDGVWVDQKRSRLTGEKREAISSKFIST